MTEHLRTTCPGCGYHHDRVTQAEDGDLFPENGDATMCWSCGGFFILDSTTDDGMRKPTKTEQRQLDDDERIAQIHRAWLTVRTMKQ